MSSLRSSFRKKHIFLPVIHAENQDQALRNTLVARDNGADGIFLINHKISAASLIQIYLSIQSKLESFWIGVNCLGTDHFETLRMLPNTVSGLWRDNAGIDESAPNPTEQAERFAEFRMKNREWFGWEGLYFGGVAFKHQPTVKNLARVVELAKPFVDIITTSGIDTGKAADLQKVRAMKKAAGDHPLALASGLTPENVESYMPFVDAFLVATGISNANDELNANRVRQFAKKVAFG